VSVAEWRMCCIAVLRSHSMSRTAGPLTLEDIRSASRGRPSDASIGIQAPEYEMGTCSIPKTHEGTGKRGEEIKADERAQISSKGGDTGAVEKSRIVEEEESTDKDVIRAGGALDDVEFKGRDIELGNELLLVALGLGQHRAEDGSTTLFEQEAIFGELDEQSNEKSNKEDTAFATKEVQSQEPQVAATTASKVGDFGSRAWTAASSSFGRASKEVKERAASGVRAKDKAPLKPNETCHYDARARSIIFVALTAMNVQGMDIWMAEQRQGSKARVIPYRVTISSSSKEGHRVIAGMDG
jgi:hypothetical protein